MEAQIFKSPHIRGNIGGVLGMAMDQLDLEETEAKLKHE